MTPNDGSTKSPRPWLRFGLATFFILLTCVAGMLAGYRAGFRQGYGAGQQKRKAEEYVARVYPVSDLVLILDSTTQTFSVDFDSLIYTITSTISPEGWDSLGGPGSITSQPSTLSLVVYQHPDTHDEIAALLIQLREKATGLGVGFSQEKQPQLPGGTF